MAERRLVRYTIDLQPERYQALKEKAVREHNTVSGEIRHGIALMFEKDRLVGELLRGEIEPEEVRGRVMGLVLLA